MAKKAKKKTSETPSINSLSQKYDIPLSGSFPTWFNDFSSFLEERVIVFDRNGTPLILNQETASSTGYTRNEMSFSITDPVMMDEIGILFDQAKNTGKVARKDLKFNNNGTEVVFKAALIPLIDQNIFSGAIGIIKNAPESINNFRSETKKLKEAQRIAHIGDWENDVPAKSVVWSDETYRIFGYIPGEKSPVEIFNEHLHPDDREAYWAHIKKQLASGKKEIPDYEFRIINKQGEIRHCIARGEFQFDTVGKPYYAFGTIQDVTEQKNIQHALQKSEEKFKAVFDMALNYICILDTNHFTILHANFAFEEMAGAHIEPGSNTSFLEFLHPEDRPKTLDLFEKILKKGKSIYHLENRFLTKDNSYHLLDWNIQPDPTSGCAYAIANDITELKSYQDSLLQAKEKAEESDRLKSAFLANISHEIRTPLNGIIGFADLLSSPDLDKVTRSEYMDILNTCSQQLISLVENILDISKIETKQINVHKTHFNVNDLIKNVYTTYEKSFEKKGISLRLSLYQPDSDCILFSDETKIRKILSHLLDNALKFTKKGYVTFGWTIRGNLIEFFVQDTGPGISEDAKFRIFEKFYQVESGMTRSYTGLGLGLAISKAFAEVLGGEIRYEVFSKGGSVFFLSLPARDVSVKENFIRHDTIYEKYLNSKQQPTILIVEDEEANLRLLEEILGQMNLNVLKASNGYEAVEICRKNHRIELIFMDLKMPVMDGFQAVSKIKEIRPGIRVIAQTALSDDEVKTKLVSAGFSDYLEKPIKIKTLLDLINKYSQ